MQSSVSSPETSCFHSLKRWKRRSRGEERAPRRDVPPSTKAQDYGSQREAGRGHPMCSLGRQTPIWHVITVCLYPVTPALGVSKASAPFPPAPARPPSNCANPSRSSPAAKSVILWHALQSHLSCSVPVPKISLCSFEKLGLRLFVGYSDSSLFQCRANMRLLNQTESLGVQDKNSCSTN